MQVSDEWHTCSKEISLFKKIFSQLTMTPEGKARVQAELSMKKKRDYEKIMNMSYKNIEDIKTMDFIETHNDLSVKMAPACKIRSHSYYTVAACIKNKFEVDYFFSEHCQVLSRLIADFKNDSHNDYIYQPLLQCLQSVRKE
jgi:hypothetical protein